MIVESHPRVGGRLLLFSGIRSERTLTIPLSMDVRRGRRSLLGTHVRSLGARVVEAR